MRTALLSALLSALVCALLTGCGGDESASTTPTTTQATTTAPPAGGCTEVEAPEPRGDGGEKAPSGKLDPAKRHEVEIVTNCGSFTIELDVETSPNTTASFAALARSGFYSNTVFHRIVPEFVIQGGDPTASGRGGPGYSTVDPPPRTARYTKGVVAMAKTATEPPGTAGSQFFVVTGEDIGLPPEYGILGKVTKGLDVVERIGRLGDRSTQAPLEVVRIERATVTER